VASFLEGKLHGPFLEWHRNGKPARAGAYERGVRVETWTVWFANGREEEICSYAEGDRHGPFVAFWPNGKRKIEGHYCHGLQCGPWRSWDEDGRELGSVRYEEIRRAP
jgi:antitoxin component YwqK of YwqJK toxin-antitoxin module